ncbi:MAG TPA: methionine synthase [Anaerolineae bacterium]|nr:methionine synthase [Anaerolineae bacterium]
MKQEHPNCRATGIGSTPHTDSATAVEFVLETFAEIPFWPQLPRRAFRENMYAQFSEYLPGIRIEDADERIWIDLGAGWIEEVETFYAAFLEDDPSRFPLSAEHAAGLHELMRRGPLEDTWAVKGQVIGPISFGLQVSDQDLRPSLYDERMHDVIVKNVLRQAQWQEARLRALCPRTIVFIDEPFLSMIGSAYASLSREQVIAALEEIFSGLAGWTGVHCCANTDWSMLLATSVDILSFDAYEYAEHLALYPDELRAFLAGGGILAWGVIPNTGEAAETITVDGAWEVLERALTLFERKGFDRRELLPRSLITPACGTGTLSIPVAERVMRLARQLSDRVRQEYGLETSRKTCGRRAI